MEASETQRRLRGGAAEKVRHMTARVEHLSEMIDALLDYSHLSVHFRPSQRRIVDMKDIVAGAITIVETSATARRQQLHADASTESAAVKGDPARLRQAVSNLLQNAIRYTPEEGQISVSVCAADGTVRVSVRDSGEGIARDRLPAIFEPFEGGASAARLGIGLALVRRIAEMHGGSVTADSEGSGRGSLFTLLLPRA